MSLFAGKVSTFARRTQAIDPFFHYQPWGEARNFVLSPLAQWTAETIVFRQFQINPLTSRSDVVSVLRSLGGEYLKIHLDWLYRTIRKHKWGFKVPQRRQVLKYEPDNVIWYAQYITIVPKLPVMRLKYLDESHFKSKLLTRRRACGPRGRRAVVINEADIVTAYSVTLIIGFHSPNSPHGPVRVQYREHETNSALDFFRFVGNAIAVGFLTPGDILVLDNASIHKAWRMSVELMDLLAASHIYVLFLPAYSPELNPDELVFQYVKTFLQDNRIAGAPFISEIDRAFASVSPARLWSFYEKCLNQ